MTHRPAGFLIRLLADLIDVFLLAIIFSVAIFVLAQSQTLAQLVQGLLIYLITLGLPLMILGIFYRPAFTHYFGGSIGKLLTGLKVTDLNGHLLTFRRALFRFTIAQTFSTVLFGLGYLSIIKDPEKRAFHDKATPSKVVITKTLWPLGLIILAVLLITHFMLWANTIQSFSNNPVKSEFGFLMLNLSQQLKNEEVKTNTKDQDSSFNTRLDQIYILSNGKNYQQAQTEAEQLEKITQDQVQKAQVDVALADISYAQNKLQTAKEYALKAVIIDPENPDAYQILTEIEIANKDYRTALTYSQTALKLTPDSAVNHNDAGIALYHLGRVDEGIAEVKKAIELNPNNQNFRENLKDMESNR